MGAERRNRSRSSSRILAGSPNARARSAAVDSAKPDAESRVITLRDGVRSLVTVVARLVSEDVPAGQDSARLVVRFECLAPPRRSVRVATVRARSLHAVDDESLRLLAEVPATRVRRAALQRCGGGG